MKGSAEIAPVAAFTTSDTLVVAPATVRFTDLSEGVPVDWTWDFQDDGVPDSTVRHPSYRYDMPGLKTVRLTVSNPGGTDQEIKIDLVCVTGSNASVVRGVAFSSLPSRFVWDETARGSSYDVVRGDLFALRETGGRFDTASAVCLADDGVDTEAIDPALPDPGEGYFYLVRSSNCAGRTGSFDAESQTQFAPRDLALQGPSSVCDCTAADDPDRDGYCNHWDNCPETAGSSVDDSDADGLGDVCDACPYDPVDDADADGLCADLDNCPTIPNP